jgi:hypothetical protein
MGASYRVVCRYNSNSVHRDEYEGEGQRKALERMLYAAGVDACFYGHVHSYERSHRSLEFAPDDCAPVHIVIGDGGNREGIAGPWMQPQPEWSAFREGSYGHGTLQVESATRAVWRWHRNDNGTTAVADELVLNKRPHCEVALRRSRAAISAAGKGNEGLRASPRLRGIVSE